MLKSVILKSGEVRSCSGCCEARGISKLGFLNDVQLGNMNEFEEWFVDSDKVLSF